MSPETLYFITQSIFAIIGSFLLIGLASLLVAIYIFTKRIDAKVEEIIDDGRETLAETRYLVNKASRNFSGLIFAKIKKILEK